MQAPWALAIDIGGTKLAVARVRPDGEVFDRRQVPTPAGDGETVWAALAGLVGSVAAPVEGSVEGSVEGCVGVGIGTAGPIDLGEGTVSPVNIGGWRRFPIVERVRSLVSGMPGVPVRLVGDGVAIALGERWRGAGQGCDDLVGMVVSTGVGGGLVLRGRPHVGPSGNAGHIGHISVDLEGPRCACGGIGCVEAIASGRSIAAWAASQGFTGGTDAAAVAAAAAAGDVVALAAFDRAGRAIGSMLAGLATVCDVRVAVIGGGVANAGEVLFAPIRSWLDRYAALPYASGLELRRARLGGDAGLVGAASLLFDER
ncbi:MAG: ROK family protein [Acidimicrobiales bacterium]